MRCTVLLLVAVAAVACGGSPVAPSPQVTQIPQVAGTYTGPATFAVRGLGISEAGTGEIGVTQAGRSVTLVASWTFQGPTFNDPSVSGTIDATGLFTRSGGEVQTPTGDFDENCGMITSQTLTVTFSGSTMRFSDTEQTELCGQLGISATLTR